MKYRVKDPKKRELVKELFGVEIVRSNFADTELRVDLSFAGHNFATNLLPVEQVQELAEGWHPYPEEKPKETGWYLVAIKMNSKDDVDHSQFSTKTGQFFSCDSITFAWREMPKIWKE